LLTFLSLAIGIAVFVVVLGKSGLSNILIPFKSFSPFYLVLYLFVSFLVGLLTTYRWRMILRRMGHELPIKKLFVYRATGFAIGYITPTARLGGEPVRALMLSKHGVPIKKAYASIVLDKLLDFSMGAVVMSVALFFSLAAFRFPMKTTFFFVGVILGSIIAFYVLYSRLLKREGLLSRFFEIVQLSKISVFKKMNRHIKIVESYASDFLCNKKYLSELMVISVAMWVLFIIEFKLALLLIGFNATLLQIFLVMLFFGIAILLPVPASLGVLEAGQVSAFTVLQAGPSFGIAVAFVLRFKDLLWTLFGLTMFSRRELRKITLFNKK
jgi:hypothetical protein